MCALLKKIYNFLKQGHIKLIKIDSKIFIKLQMISISNKCWSLYLSVHQRITVSIKNIKEHKHFQTLILIRNVSWAADPDIRMIYEGLCDTEDKSNSCWKFSFTITKINDTFFIYINISTYFTILLFILWFGWINAALVAIWESKPLNRCVL